MERSNGILFVNYVTNCTLFCLIDSMGVPLMQCLTPLLKRVQQGTGGKTVVALFRSIFWYYKHHWDSELEREIYWLVANVSSY